MLKCRKKFLQLFSIWISHNFRRLKLILPEKMLDGIIKEF